MKTVEVGMKRTTRKGKPPKNIKGVEVKGENRNILKMRKFMKDRFKGEKRADMQNLAKSRQSEKDMCQAEEQLTTATSKKIDEKNPQVRGTCAEKITEGGEQKKERAEEEEKEEEEEKVSGEKRGGKEVKLSHTQRSNIIQESIESHEKGKSEMRSAKPKSCISRAVPTPESREIFQKNQPMGLFSIKSSSKISTKIANMRRIFESKSESSTSGKVRVGPIGAEIID